MDNSFFKILNDSEMNPDEVLDVLTNKNDECRELREFVESSGNLSIDSIGNIVEHTSALEEQTDKPDEPSPTAKKQSSPKRTEEPASPVILSKNATSKPWTKNKRNTSCSYIKNIAYRRTTFSKKVKSMKKQAEDLAKQTGAQIKIIIFNPDSKKL